MGLVNYADLVWVTTSTTGTGAITPGAALAGYRAASTLSSGASYNYSISDQSGTAYETGVGVWNGSTLTRSVTESSNSNNPLSLSGSAQVVIGQPLAADLNAMNVQAWPVLVATNNNGTFQNFNTIALTATTDTAGAWNAANSYWTVPVAGIYELQGKARAPDNSSAQGFGVGLGTVNDGDTAAAFLWGVINPSYRSGIYFTRTMTCNVGDQLRLYGYSDQSVSIIQASLTILRVR